MDLRVPAKVRGVDKENPRSGDGGWGGLSEMADLKHEPHGGRERNTLVAGQGQDLGSQGREELEEGRGRERRRATFVCCSGRFI